MKTRLEHPDRACWQRAVRGFADYSYRQAWDFGVACAARVGACSEHVAIHEGTDLVGLADVRVKRLPLLNTGIAYINGGPLVRRNGTNEPERLRGCLAALLEEYVQRRKMLLRVLPSLGEPTWNEAQEQSFRAMGFAAAAEWPGYRTLLLAIDRPLEQIRKGFEQKWRNGLNRAERNGLVIRSGSEGLLFESFCGLYRGLLARKGFAVDLDADFHAGVQARLDEGERFVVSLAEAEGEPVAGHVASMLGDTCVYLLGASNDAGMQTKASYLLQWHTIQRAQERGCRWYDLGGIDPEGNPGVYHFKEGLGGLDLRAAGPFEAAPAGVRRHIVRGCERVYRSVRSWRGAGRAERAPAPGQQGAST